MRCILITGTSPCLFHYQKGRGVDAVGTVHVNCKYMSKNLHVKTRGDVGYRSIKTGMCPQGYDKRPITVMLTVHNREMVTISDGHGYWRVKPFVVFDYNVGMKGMELSQVY